jgi:hypothetical protein
MKSISWFLILMIIIILFLGYYNKEKFTDDIFYSSSIRLRDFQDVLSITESQAIKTN